MKNTIFAVAALACLGAATTAQAVTLDFDSGTATYSGTNNLTGYAQDGFSFAIALDTPDRQASGANLFDTASCLSAPNTVASCNGNDDGDLVPGANTDGVGGNVLIRQEDGASLDDDARGSGSITFTLLSGSAFRLLGFSGVDDGDFSIVVGGVTLGSLSLANDNETGSTAFSTSPVLGVGDSFTVTYGGSGGVDAISIAPVPLPAALPLLALGLGGLVAMGRRRTA